LRGIDEMGYRRMRKGGKGVKVYIINEETSE
jgi:hypothetical protein